MLPYEKSPNHYQTGEQRKVDLPILKKENLLNKKIMYFRIGKGFSYWRQAGKADFFHLDSS